MSESSSFADAVAAEALSHMAVRQRAETAEAEKRAFIIAEVSKLAAEAFEVLRTRVDLAVPVVTQLDPSTTHRPDNARPWIQVGHVWDLDLVGMRSTGEFTSRLSIAEHRPDSWIGAPLPASAFDRRTGMLRWVHAGTEPAVTPDNSTFFSLFGVADNGELGVMDYWGAERHVRARTSLASSIGRLQATGSAR